MFISTALCIFHAVPLSPLYLPWLRGELRCSSCTGSSPPPWTSTPHCSPSQWGWGPTQCQPCSSRWTRSPSSWWWSRGASRWRPAVRTDRIFPQPGLKALDLELITREFDCSIIWFVPGFAWSMFRKICRKEKRKKIGGVGVDGPGGVTGEEICDILLLCICIFIVTSSKF